MAEITRFNAWRIFPHGIVSCGRNVLFLVTSCIYSPTTPGICYPGNSSHPMPRCRSAGKGAKAYFEVRERASPCPVWSSPHTTSFILPDTPANPWGPNSHVQDYPWSHGIPHGIHLRLSNPPRATRSRIHVPPTAMLYAPSPIRLHHSGCPILEQTAFWESQRIVGEIFQGTSGCPLAVPVPQSTHLTHNPFPQHTSTYAKTHTLITLPIYPHHPLGVFRCLYCSVEQ